MKYILNGRNRQSQNSTSNEALPLVDNWPESLNVSEYSISLEHVSLYRTVRILKCSYTVSYKIRFQIEL